MTKKEYIKHAMHLCPTRKYWREMVERAINAGCIDIKGAETFREVYPLAAAIAERLAGFFVNGSCDPATQRWTRREADNIKCFI